MLVLIAVQFSFNDSRSRTLWQGFSTRWYWGDPVDSVWHDPALRNALVQSLKLAILDILIATPIGVLLKIGLARWSGGGGRGPRTSHALPLVTPEIVMGVPAPPLLFTHVFAFVGTGTTTAQILAVAGHFDLLRRRHRPGTPVLDRETGEEAAADLGASPAVALIASSYRF